MALAWGAFLRAGEVISGLRKHLVLPSDVEYSMNYALFAIEEPKTKNVAARHQTAKLDIPDLLEFIELMFHDLQKHQRLWPQSGQTLRTRLKSLLRHLGLPAEPSHRGKPLDVILSLCHQ